MKADELREKLKKSPVIAAIKNADGLSKCAKCECAVCFILYGNINNISEIVETVQNSGKAAFVHLDLIEGLSSKEAAVDFIAKNTKADGVLSTKAPLIKYAKNSGLLTVQRYFILDSLALENVLRNDRQSNADFIEILPGLMPKIINKLSNQMKHPIIAGGLINEKQDVKIALNSGALGVSSTCENIWFHP